MHQRRAGPGAFTARCRWLLGYSSGDWCGRRDLHPQRACAHRHLGPARLLISPHPRKTWSGGPESHRSPRGHNAMLCLLELRTWKDGPPPVAKPWIRFRRSPRQSRRTVETGRSGEIRTHVVSVPSRVPETARLRSEKMGAGVGVAPTSPGLMRPGGTTGSTRSGKIGGAPRCRTALCPSSAGRFHWISLDSVDTTAGFEPAWHGFAGRPLRPD